MAIKQSHPSTAKFVDSSPCIPKSPNESSWSSGIEPLPIRLVATGIFAFVANSTNSSEAFASITPPPASMIGFLESCMACMAFFICLGFPPMFGLYPFSSSLSSISTSVTSFSKTSFGRSTTTTPGLPVDAMWYAASIVFGTSLDFLG